MFRGEFKGLKLHCKEKLAFLFLGYVSALEHSLSLPPVAVSGGFCKVFWEERHAYEKEESHCKDDI